MKRLLIIASLALMIVSCKNDKIEIDSTSAQTFSETVDEISKSLPLLQQDKFKEALQIVFEYKTNRDVSDESRWATVRELLNGKSVDEVFDLAEKIALENKFTWNRNQVPLVNGIPKLADQQVEENTPTDPNSDIQRFDFSINQDEKNISLTPFFYNAQGQETQLNEPVTATIDVFNSGNIVYSFRSTINPSSSSDLYRNNLITINYSSLDASKLKNETLDIAVRIQNPERYLTSRKSITIPLDLLGLDQASDSIAIANANTKAVNKDAEMAKSLSNRFISNISKKNYSGAFALTRNNDWTTFQKFSSNTTLKSLEQATIKSTSILDADEKITLVGVEVNLKDNSSATYQLTLENINNKLFIVGFK